MVVWQGGSVHNARGSVHSAANLPQHICKETWREKRSVSQQPLTQRASDSKDSQSLAAIPICVHGFMDAKLRCDTVPALG